jgi:hypothetical protein
MPLLNVKDAADFKLAVAWLLAALRSVGPYPVLVLLGEQGTAKSTFARIMRSLVDPNVAPLRSPPKDEDDLIVAARNGHVISFDNVSRLPDWISDALCRLATGGGFGNRELYTNQDEILFNGTRPFILNGIESFVTRGDLSERSLILALEPIPDRQRKTEAAVMADFEEVRPKVLGVLLDAVASGIKNLDSTKLDSAPRMADFAHWASACEPGCGWKAGDFMAAYNANRTSTNEGVIEADLVATAVVALMVVSQNEPNEWSGTASELLHELRAIVGEEQAKSRNWPRAANTLSNRLTRVAPSLRKIGITIDKDKEGHKRHRIIKLTYNQSPADTGKPSSASPAEPDKSNKSASGNGSDADNAADHEAGAGDAIVRTNQLTANDKTDADGADDTPHRVVCRHCGKGGDAADPLLEISVAGDVYAAHRSCADASCGR